MRRSARPVATLAIFLLPLLLSGCNGNGGDGLPDGGETCGLAVCASSEDCINDSVCVPRADSPAEAFREEWYTEDSKEKVEYISEGAADLSCHNIDACAVDADCPMDDAGTQLACRDGFCGLPAPDGPATVTFRGCVDAFGIGDVTDNMLVALYRVGQDPTGSTQWDMASTSDRDGCKYWGAFEFADVPTNTPLILKTYDPDKGFITTYKYNLVLWADLAEDDGTGNFVFDTRSSVADPRTGMTIELHPWRAFAISATTYAVILMAVGISELPENQGAVAGTIRDCAYNFVKNVRCGVVDKPTKLTYFTNAENPRPDRSRDSSNVNGTYAAIGLQTGSHRVSCLAQDADGNQVLLGEYEIEVFDHGVTILSFDWYPGVD